VIAATDTILEQELPRARLAVLLKHFSQLEDDRDPWRVMYPLKEVLLLLTCAAVIRAGYIEFGRAPHACLGAAMRNVPEL